MIESESILASIENIINTFAEDDVKAQGIEWFNAGQVDYVNIDSDGLGIYGTVVDDFSQSFETVIRIENEFGIAVGCPCPQNRLCEHLVAVMLAAKARFANLNYVSWPARGTNIDWKGLQYTQRVSSRQLDSVGLIFEVIDTNTLRSRFGSPSKIPGSEMLLNCRICTMQNGGKWRITTINWENLNNNFKYHESKNSLRLNSLAVDVLVEIKGIYLSDIDSDWMTAGEWMHISRCRSLRLFGLFEEFEKYGGKFLYNAASKPAIKFNDHPIVPVVKFDKDENDGMKYTVSLKHNNRLIQPGNFVIESGKGYWGFVFSGNLADKKTLKDFHLARIEPNLEPTYHPVAYGGYNVQIPKSDIESFSKTQYIELNKSLIVSGDDSSFVLPKLEGPILIIKTTSSGYDSIFIEFTWRYGIDLDKYSFPISNLNEGINLRNWPKEIEVKLRASKLLNRLEIFKDGINTDMAILNKMDAYVFLSQCVEDLNSDKDIAVLIDSEVPDFNFHGSEPEILVNAKSSSDTDWLDINISLEVDGVKINYSELVTALLSDEDYLFLESGDIIELDHPKIHQLKQLVLEAQKLKDRPAGDFAINRYNISFFEELNELGIIDSQAKEWLDLSKKLYNLDEIETYEVGPKFEGTLRAYQEIGYNWLMFLVSNSLGGILADDMGLGKTVQVIAMISARTNSQKCKKPSLVIAPTSVVPNWSSEFQKFAPDIKTTMLRSTVARSKLDLKSEIENMDVLITSYAIIQRDIEVFSKIDWDVVIIDEAQYLKNYQAKTYGAVRKLQANSKIALTGTPLENNLMELWSILSIVAPGLFSVREQFRDRYQRPVESGDDPEQLKRLKRRIRPFILRRLKEDVLQELPPRIEQVVNLDLIPSHQKVYDLYLSRERQKVLGLLDDFKKNRFTILRSLVILRMLSLSAVLVDSEKYSGIQSAKIDALMDYVEELLSENHKAIIFSQFTSFLALIKEAFVSRKIPFSYLDGKTRNRADVISEFKDGQTDVFLISLKAGGVGLNLMEADYCFLMDPWWNPAIEQQAIDRMHRIGQSKPVNVYRFVSNGTIEEKVMQLKERKSKLFHSVLDEDASFSKAISAEDIKGLFEELK